MFWFPFCGYDLKKKERKSLQPKEIQGKGGTCSSRSQHIIKGSQGRIQADIMELIAHRFGSSQLSYQPKITCVGTVCSQWDGLSSIKNHSGQFPIYMLRGQSDMGNPSIEIPFSNDFSLTSRQLELTGTTTLGVL